MNISLPIAETFSPSPEIPNIERLIKFFRDGVCHANIPNHRFEDRLHMGVRIATWKGWATKIADKIQECEFENEVAIFMGHHRIYLRRHMLRAFHELQDIFEKEGINAKLDRPLWLPPDWPPPR